LILAYRVGDLANALPIRVASTRFTRAARAPKRSAERQLVLHERPSDAVAGRTTL